MTARTKRRTTTTKVKVVEIIDHTDYWTYECLIDEIFLRLAGTKEIIPYQGRNVTIYRYYHQAMVLRPYLAVAYPRPQFIVNLSDLTPKIISELKDVDDVQLVLRQAVGRIFENIDFRLYHLSIAKVLNVRLVK